MNLFSLFSVIFILELVARWQYLAIWFRLRMKNKSVIQDLGVKIKTAFINWDPSTGIWNISLVNNQRFRSCFSHDPASVHLLHIFTRSVSGSTTDLLSDLSFHCWKYHQMVSQINRISLNNLFMLQGWNPIHAFLDQSRTDEACINT